jgi:hypothetical protein
MQKKTLNNINGCAKKPPRGLFLAMLTAIKKNLIFLPIMKRYELAFSIYPAHNSFINPYDIKLYR